MGYASIAIIYQILAIIIAYYSAVGDSFFNKSLRLGKNMMFLNAELKNLNFSDIH
jgi:hypothetical protein